MMMPAILTDANFTGRPSYRNLAKASVVSASNAMIKALSVKNSGCEGILKRFANCWLNKISIAVRIEVEKIREIVAVL